MAETRIYLVSDMKSDPPEHRLVRSATAAQARHHVTSERFAVDVAKQEAIVDLLEKGVKVETAPGRAVAAVLALLVLAFGYAQPVKAADIAVQHDGVTVFHATAAPAMGTFDPQAGVLNFTGTPTPPTGCIAPAGLTRLTRSAISYGAGPSLPSNTRQNVDVTEWNNIWGHATVSDAGSAWAGVSGAGPVVRAYSKHSFISAHFNTGSVPMYQGSLAYQSNIGGPDIDVVISRTCGDFAHNEVMPGCSVTMPSDGQPHLKYFSNGAPAGTTQCSLALNTDYWINVRMHDPSSNLECLGSICPLYAINYWYPAP